MEEPVYDDEGNLVIPPWVDYMVGRMLADYLVVAGPYQSVLVGEPKQGKPGYDWFNGNRMESATYGVNRIFGPYKNAILTRLRRGAHTTVGAALLHPYASGGSVVLTDKVWRYAAEGEEAIELCHQADAVVIDMGWVCGHNIDRRVGMAYSAGTLKRVVGVVADGDVAYPMAGEANLRRMIVPCPPGGERRIICVTEHQQDEYLTYAVRSFGFGRNGATDSVRFSEYKSHVTPVYYPFMRTLKSGTQTIVVLFVPDQQK